MDFIRNSINQSDEKIRRCYPISFVDQLNERKFRGAINSHKKIELSFGCLNLSNINMKEANRIGSKLSLRAFVAFNIGQSTNAMSLKTSVK